MSEPSKIIEVIDEYALAATESNPKNAIVIDSITGLDVKSAADTKRVPVEQSDLDLVGYNSLSDIPEVRAIIELMREEMARVRNNRSVAEFIRKQKFKRLEADYATLGGRCRAMVKILSLWKANPDYIELQEDLKDCAHALALLTQNLAERYKFNIAAKCRELFPLTEDEAKARDAYEDRVLAERAAEATEAAEQENEDHDPEEAFDGIDAAGALK